MRFPRSTERDAPSKRQRTRDDVEASHVTQSNILLRYPFVLPLTLPYLYDPDVLIGLLASSKALKNPLIGYAVQGGVCESFYRELVLDSDNRYLPLSFSWLHDVSDPKLASIATLTRLYLNTACSLSSIDNWSDKLIHLSVGSYDQSMARGTSAPRRDGLGITSLPHSLRKLVLGPTFSLPLPLGVLPESLKSLTLGEYFNCTIDPSVWPSQLKTLKFGELFNIRLNVGVLPASLEKLKFGHCFAQPIDVGVLPASLKALTVGDDPPVLVAGAIPESVESLFGAIPESVESLFMWNYKHPLHPDVLPTTLKSLRIIRHLASELSPGCLPDTLEVLEVGSHQGIVLQAGVVPASVEYLVLGSRELNAGVLPVMLYHLDLPFFNQPITPAFLPSSLKTLKLRRFNQPLAVGCLPQLTELTLPGFKQPLASGVLPATLKRLDLGGYFEDQLLEPGIIPLGVVRRQYMSCDFGSPNMKLPATNEWDLGL